MDSSLPNDKDKDKDKAPQPTNGPQAAPAAESSSDSDSDSGKGGTGPVGVPPQQAVVPTWATGLFECFDDIPTRMFYHIILYHITFVIFFINQ